MKKVLLILILTSYISVTYSQNYKLKAVLIYNFAKFLTWENDNSKSFEIGVFGHNEIVDELKIISKNYKVSDKEIIISEFKSLNDIKDCKLLYITNDKINEIDSVASKVKDFRTVLITSSEKESDKVGINFVIIDDKQRFEIYPENIESKKIKINPKLIKLGIIK